MAWIESHQSLKDHPKTRRLARRLGISVPAAIGHLHCLWWWALEYAQDGSLAQYDADDIADAMMWDGDSQQLVQALVHAGFLDETGDGLRIHDWRDYAGRLIEQRERAAARKREMRQAYEDGVIDQVRARDGSICRYCGKTVNWKDRRGPDGGTYDHIDPNGPSTVDNLVVCCRSCHSRKGARTPQEAGMRLLPPGKHQVRSRSVPDPNQNGTGTNLPTVTVTQTGEENNPPPPLRGASPHGGDARPADRGATNPPDEQSGRVRRMIPHEAIKDAWNEICGAAGLPRVQVLSAKRRQYLTARCTELARYFGEQVYTVDWWRGVFHRVRGSPFCMGAGGRGWRATFDWLIERREAVVRLIEGHYDRVADAQTAFERTREQFQPGRTDEDFAGWRKRGGGST
ncbi:HNH endonuclease [Thermaerobacter marianensis DSM 12885]|uniref:HNH endonuclease n=1 Tax=Thermaerobacter marianensis (strain ATCC 700841 / DSM 12885 / JCM 10246 / 7p75a) TaxID=644966 RepID=E6SKG7_THEM7|nr:HNH endonuclease [Thermaerobacter marianensis]ADU50154.1 HNH endonuclease [Thermaerobacter marianensis DSM 12885]